MAFSDLASSLYIVLLNVKFTTMASNSHKTDTDKSYDRRRKEPPHSGLHVLQVLLPLRTHRFFRGFGVTEVLSQSGRRGVV